MIQEHTDQELESGYFSYNMLPEYQRTVKPLPLIYYDPRGELHEPHTGNTVPLGTREVEGYTLPKNLYNKMLYIEKKGFWPPIEDAKLAERYDMAVVVGQGYAVEAARTLFERAMSDGDTFRIFVHYSLNWVAPERQHKEAPSGMALRFGGCFFFVLCV